MTTFESSDLKTGPVSIIMGCAVLLMGVDGILEMVNGEATWAFSSFC